LKANVLFCSLFSFSLTRSWTKLRVLVFTKKFIELLVHTR
jgi:hypothetical protein